MTEKKRGTEVLRGRGREREREREGKREGEAGRELEGARQDTRPADKTRSVSLVPLTSNAHRASGSVKEPYPADFLKVKRVFTSPCG